LCGKSFAQRGNLAYHRQYKHTEVVDPDDTNMLSCSQCGKFFVRKGDLNHHKRFHAGEKSYSCTLCGKSFARSDKLKLHCQKNHAEAVSSKPQQFR
jgi:KRAB domain-containing zinc finger protein